MGAVMEEYVVRNNILQLMDILEIGLWLRKQVSVPFSRERAVR